MKKISMFLLVLMMFCVTCSAKTIYSDDNIYAFETPESWTKMPVSNEDTGRVLLSVTDSKLIFISLMKGLSNMPVKNFSLLTDDQRDKYVSLVSKQILDSYNMKGEKISNLHVAFLGPKTPGISDPLSISYFLKINDIHFMKRLLVFNKDYTEYSIEAFQPVLLDPKSNYNDNLNKLIQSVMFSLKRNGEIFIKWAADPS